MFCLLVYYRLVPVYPNTLRNCNHYRELYYRDCDYDHLDDGDDDDGDDGVYHRYPRGILLEKQKRRTQMNKNFTREEQISVLF